MKQIDYIRRWYADPARNRGKVVRPRQLNFPVTDTCNARCVMCDVWKENATDDMSLDELTTVLMQPFFQDLEHVGISGGEPFLRRDLVEIVKVFFSLPKLRSLSITSHGFNHVRHQVMGPRIAALAHERGVPFTMNLSIDGVGAIHDRVRRVPGGFEKLQRTLELYRALGVRIVGQCTVSKVNLFNLPQLEQFALTNNVDLIYRLSTTIERLYNKDSMSAVELDRNERSFLADFLVYSGVIQRTRNPARRLFYRQLVDTLQTGASRSAPCYFQNEAALLSASGEVFQCSIVENSVCNARSTSVDEAYFSPGNLRQMAKSKRDICGRCTHDQSGAWAPRLLIEEQLRNTKIGRQTSRLPEFVEKSWVTLLAYSLPDRTPVTLLPGERRNAVIIGCYGGEHVGDAAILGGVLLRLNREFGVTCAVVLSSRVDRTEGWVAQLQTPLTVAVKLYDEASTAEAISGADILAIGGGPVMDLPVLLAQHIHAARLAKRCGLPVVAEGIGFGPFRRSVSRSLARKLLRLTSRASFRTQESFEAAKEFASNPIQTFDPAFTYLDQVNVDTPPPPTYVARLRRTGRPLIALNLRPLWTRYATRNFDDAKVRAIESNCLAVITETVNRHPECDFIFVPFNSDQFGMSDLNVANQMRGNKQFSRNFHIWEGEPSIEQLIGALRVCDALIAMRFHACIFGISTRSCPVFGIDYGIGKASKVAELFNDNPGAGECNAVDAITVEDLSAFIERVKVIRESTSATLVDA